MRDWPFKKASHVERLHEFVIKNYCQLASENFPSFPGECGMRNRKRRTAGGANLGEWGVQIWFGCWRLVNPLGIYLEHTPTHIEWILQECFAILRLSCPNAPFNVISYGFVLTGVPYSPQPTAHWIHPQNTKKKKKTHPAPPTTWANFFSSNAYEMGVDKSGYVFLGPSGLCLGILSS